MLGCQLLHIFREKEGRSKLQHTIISTEYENNDPGSFEALMSEYDAYGSDYDTKTRLSLALLRVCSQVYSEARYVPWSSNIFVFSITSNKGRVLRSFMRHFNLEAVRKPDLEIYNIEDISSEAKLRDTMSMVVGNMRNLERVRLAINDEWEKRLTVEQKSRHLQVVLVHMRPLLELPLKTLTVVMHDKALEKYARAQLAFGPAITESQPTRSDQADEIPEDVDKVTSKILDDATVQPTYNDQAGEATQYIDSLSIASLDSEDEKGTQYFDRLSIASLDSEDEKTLRRRKNNAKKRQTVNGQLGSLG